MEALVTRSARNTAGEGKYASSDNDLPAVGATFAVIVALVAWWSVAVVGASGPAWDARVTFGVIPTYAVLAVVNWTVVTVTVMLPAAVTAALAYARVAKFASASSSVGLAALAFFGGHVVVWPALAIAGAGAQSLMASGALMDTAMRLNDPIPAAAVMIAVGAFQLTAIKRESLQRSRMPKTFCLQQWRAGARGAFAMGVRHAAYCAVGSWLVLPLLFVVGVANPLWVLCLAAFAMVEREAPFGIAVGQFGGAGLIAVAILTL